MHDQVVHALAASVITVLSGFGAGFLMAQANGAYNDTRRLIVLLTGILGGGLVFGFLIGLGVV